MDGDHVSAEQWLKQARSQFEPKEAKLLESLVGLFQEIGDQDVLGQGVSSTRLAMLAARFLAVWAAAKADTNRSPSAGQPFVLPHGGRPLFQVVPPVRKAIDLLKEALRPDLAQLFQRDNTRQIDKLDQMLKIHPEGTLHLLHAAMLLGERRWAEAEAASLEAARTPALLPGVAPIAYYHAAAAAANLYQSEGKQAEVLKRLDGYADQWLASGRAHPNEAADLGNMALVANNLELAQRLVDAGLRADPKNPRLLTGSSIIALKRERYGEAIQWADKALEQSPGDAKLLQLRRDAIEKLQSLLGKVQSEQKPTP
jgi:tetratricopeptide (TPR) repeat protein